MRKPKRLLALLMAVAVCVTTQLFPIGPLVGPLIAKASAPVSSGYTRYEAENGVIVGAGDATHSTTEAGSQYSGGYAAANLDNMRCTFAALAYDFSNISHVEFTVPNRTAQGIVTVTVGYVSSGNDTIAVQANGDTPKQVTLDHTVGTSSVQVDMHPGSNTVYVSTTLNPRGNNAWVNIDYIDVSDTTTAGTVEPPETPSTPTKNPIITSIYTADPSAHVFNGHLYLYPSHDIDPPQGCNLMDKYHVYESDDMTDWTDEGQIFDAADATSWSNNTGFMWAPDAAYKNGTYYLYYPHPSDNNDWNNSWKIGVATSKSPDKDFVDAGTIPGIGGSGMIDPAVFVDDDGTAYMYYGGGGKAMGGKLNSDMVTMDGTPQAMTGLKNFHEASWVFKRNVIYYYMYADNTSPDNLMQYATSSSPLGPWTYQGEILGDTGCSTTHGSVVQYKGQWYIFYLNQAISGNGTLRSVNVDSLHFNADGSIQLVNQTKDSVAQVGDAPAPNPNTTTYAAQGATLSGGAALEQLTGSTNNSVANLSKTGSEAQFTVNGGATGGRANIHFHYSLKDSLGKVRLSVNDTDYSFVNKLTTGGEKFFTGDSNETVSLNPGSNTITVLGGNGRVNLDYITVGLMDVKSNVNVSLSTSPSTVTAMQDTTLTANISGFGIEPPEGTVTFKSGSTTLASNVPITLDPNDSSQGTAAYTWSHVPFGTQNITAEYVPSTTDDYIDSTSSTITLNVPKSPQAAPATPQVQSKTDNSVTLTPVNGVQYRMNDGNWQTSNVFTGLNPGSTYVFYEMYPGSDNYLASDTSSQAVTTDQSQKQSQNAPSAPQVQSKTDTSVTLVPITGAQYRVNGGDWQASNVFTGLDSNTKYSFYVMYPETDSHYASNASAGTVATTNQTTGQEYQVTVSAGKGGSVSNVSGKYQAGDSITISATADAGYKFSKWTTNDGGNIANANSANTTYTMPSNNATIVAEFVPIPNSNQNSNPNPHTGETQAICWFIIAGLLALGACILLIAKHRIPKNEI